MRAVTPSVRLPRLRAHLQLGSELRKRGFAVAAGPNGPRALAHDFFPIVSVVAIAATLRSRGRARNFEAFAFAVPATFFASYVGYLLMPTLGPRVPEAIEDRVLGGGALSGSARTFLLVFEVNQLDALPSGHTAISLVYLTMGWRLLPRWRAPLAVLVGGIVFATVYLSLHYVVDVVAGVVLAALMPLLLPGLRRPYGQPPEIEPAPSAPPIASAPAYQHGT